MTEITDEMRVKLAREYVRENFARGEPWSMTIARAILTERHRCAVIARKWETSSFQDEHYAANSIADKIMAGEQ
jgi:hypothetical protein